MIKKYIKHILVLVFVLFFFYLIKEINFELLSKYFTQIELYNWILLFLLFTFFYFTKSIRIWFLNKNLTISKSVYITFVHNFFLTLLPFKLWELIYIKKLKEENIKISKWFSDILLIRLYDIFVIWIFVFLSFVLFWYEFNIKIILALVFIFFVFYILFFRTKLILKVLNYIDKINKYNWIKKIIHFFSEWFSHIEDLILKKKIILIFLSFLIWVSWFLPWIFLLHLLWFWIINSIVVILFAVIFTFLPINTPWWVWVINAWWIGWLMFVNISYNEAVNLSMFVYSVFIIQLVLNYLLVQFLLHKNTFE